MYSNGEWSVTGMWNNELIANHSIGLTLLDKLREGTVSVGTTNKPMLTKINDQFLSFITLMFA